MALLFSFRALRMEGVFSVKIDSLGGAIEARAGNEGSLLKTRSAESGKNTGVSFLTVLMKICLKAPSVD